MGANSKIEWTRHTFNPWLGCSKISPGCEHCYAEAWAKRSGLVEWGPHPRRRTSTATWAQPRRWNAEAIRTGKRPRVFCASLADVFDPDAPAEWRADLWALIRECAAMDWLIVTKRIGHALAMLPAAWGDGWPNVWLLVTVTDQAEAKRDIPRLLEVPAAVRGLSCEPLLGPLDIQDWLCHYPEDEDGAPYPGEGLQWVIAGGESGPQARPVHPDWVRSLCAQCQAARVPFFFKQWGAWVDTRQAPEPAFAAMRVPRAARFADGTHVWRVGRQAAGRELDGRTWDQVPVSVAEVLIAGTGDASAHRQGQRVGTGGAR